MKINGLPLPSTLIKLLNQKRWTSAIDKDILAQITQAYAPQDFTFYGVDGMRSETASMVQLYEDGYGEIYGHTHTKSQDKSSNDDLLPVDKAIIIAGNWDEEVICLDYRDSLDNPRVVCGYIRPNQNEAIWQVVADSFDEFAIMLGIDPNM